MGISRVPPIFCFSVIVIACVSCGLAGELGAQCDPGNGPGGTGPDVIVGVLLNPDSYGNAGGYYAFSVGTTSCNIGTAELDWIAGNPNHPVIAQNMYRWLDGRFEHIGMSWLKHGFTALQGDSCGCGCIASGTGTRLGVGCSDPYGAGLNGSQSSLGPRSEVIDPANGTFLYPPNLQPANQDLTWRRLRVHGDDLDPTQNIGALYFVEAHYVTPDDAAAGNAHNNASYRQISVSPSTSDHAISYSGSTQRQLPGIQAWQDFDPAVTLVDIPDGEGGLFILGYKVTDLGSGLFDYEYALYNMNSTRGAGSVSLPLPMGVVASSVGFHDVEYHSGEPFDGTDWPVVTTGGTIEWATAPFAQNPVANALRWGSLYNFRFVANSPPGPADFAIGYFEPGTGSGVSVMVEGPTLSTLDCNGNGVVDADEIESGQGTDCDGNGLLDECQDDCDGDGLADACEILSGESLDCNADSVPDACQIGTGALADCDGDEVPDLCQIAAGASDCDGNGELDSCQIAAGALDCDANGVLDLCESSGIFGFPTVLTPPGVIDNSLPPVISVVTVNVPGILDDIDVAVDITHTFVGDLQVDVLSPSGTLVIVHAQTGGDADDIQTTYDDDGGVDTTLPQQPLSNLDGENSLGDWTLTVTDFLGGDAGTLNSWELFVGIAGAGIPDCDGNGVHDDCDIAEGFDCNLNGVVDSCDISAGISLDLNGNGIPDECDGGLFVRGDANTDGILDIADPVKILNHSFAGGRASCLVAHDANADALVDLADAVFLLSGLFSGGPSPSQPFPGCGTDPTGSGLGCDSFFACP